MRRQHGTALCLAKERLAASSVEPAIVCVHAASITVWPAFYRSELRSAPIEALVRPLAQALLDGPAANALQNRAEAVGARKGLVAQSRALLLKEWRGYGNASAPGGSYAGSGRYVYENFGADTAEGYGYSSEAQPLYSWGALAGFVGLQENGFYGKANATDR